MSARFTNAPREGAVRVKMEPGVESESEEPQDAANFDQRSLWNILYERAVNSNNEDFTGKLIC